jgi:hypothetical protein
MSHDISVTLNNSELASGDEIRGRIVISYNGRFDSLVINSLIENSNDLVSIESINGKRVSHPYPRLSLLRSDFGDTNVIEFMAKADHVPKESYSTVKFRASLIQEHKEIASSTVYLKILT